MSPKNLPYTKVLSLLVTWLLIYRPISKIGSKVQPGHMTFHHKIVIPYCYLLAKNQIRSFTALPANAYLKSPIVKVWPDWVQRSKKYEKIILQKSSSQNWLDQKFWKLAYMSLGIWSTKIFDRILIYAYLCKWDGFDCLNWLWLLGHVTNLHKNLIKKYCFWVLPMLQIWS